MSLPADWNSHISGKSADRFPTEDLGRRNFLRRTLHAAFATSVAVTALGTLFPARAWSKSVLCSQYKAPMGDVRGKVAFVTGGSSGIGLGIVSAFLRAGMKVAIGYRTKEHIDDAMTQLSRYVDRVHTISVDVTDRARMEQAASEASKHFGKIHVLVNNAGVLGLASLDATTYDDWDWLINVNLTGVFNGIRAFLPHIKAHGEGGQIVTTSSIAGLVAGPGAAGVGGYVATKFAVVGMMEALRGELAASSIGVSVYCPMWVTSQIWNSRRNRPGELSNKGFQEDRRTQESLANSLRDPTLAMEPIEAGQRVLRGMRRNHLYILDPECQEILMDRNEALISSIPRDQRQRRGLIDAYRSRRQTSIYVSERDRSDCSN